MVIFKIIIIVVALYACISSYDAVGMVDDEGDCCFLYCSAPCCDSVFLEERLFLVFPSMVSNLILTQESFQQNFFARDIERPPEIHS